MRLTGTHVVVALGVLVDLLDRLTRVLGEQLIYVLAEPLGLVGHDLDVGLLTLGPT